MPAQVSRILLLVAIGVTGLRAQTPADGYAGVSRVFAQHCLECHGPDASQREVGLRLDDSMQATARLESGFIAIVPGKPDESELLRRVRASDETRMPPADAGRPLSAAEIGLIEDWIRTGATYQTHWSFRSPTDHRVPAVANTRWPRRPLDRFVLKRIEDHGQAPREAASRRVLIRRACFDLTGLPPTPEQVRDFQQDKSPSAWPAVVDKLLESPLYGQRWGRHWLDVARYGDSNGSDENHAYPLAWRYRNYVIDALNQDVPFDQFVREQLAGDLIGTNGREAAGVVATGFLAIGTKILAEKDPVKKQADMVDEQIDTLGRALLGFTVACARCHDHKFDPIPTRDYYALAGILHSTRLQETTLDTQEYRVAKARYEQQLTRLQAQRETHEAAIASVSSAVIDREAESFQRGTAVIVRSGYGEGIGIISDPGKGEVSFAEWDYDLPTAGEYVLQFRFAAKDSRPGPLTINGQVVREDAVQRRTGGWMPPQQQWITQGRFPFREGMNTVRFESGPCMSHIDRIRLIRGGIPALQKSIKQLVELDEQIRKLKSAAPAPPMAMAVVDGQPRDTRIHLRGSHLTLGETVPRGFPAIAGGRPTSRFEVNREHSGRLELARWITDPDAGAGRQLARVIVNRVWQWHFGQGLVGSPNNFGLQGERPSHPQLLDWLSMRFIEDGWSLKALHRRILLSATYRQESVAHASDQLVGFPRRRLEAEAIRDTLLFHAGRLDTSPAERLDGVVSQNPSPEALRQNEEFHRKSAKRSVYLPVVRSNAYRFFSLFDFPNAATSVGKRDVTTVPTQALLMMNDPFIMDQATHFARSVQNSTAKATRLEVIYDRLFNRLPTPAESRTATGFLKAYRATTGATDDAELRAVAALCQTLMASAEFVYVE